MKLLGLFIAGMLSVGCGGGDFQADGGGAADAYLHGAKPQYSAPLVCENVSGTPIAFFDIPGKTQEQMSKYSFITDKKGEVVETETVNHTNSIGTIGLSGYGVISGGNTDYTANLGLNVYVICPAVGPTEYTWNYVE